MKKENIIKYFEDINMQKKVKILTTVMFLFLVIEKMCSGANAIYNNSIVEFYFSLTIIDIICIFIYIATAMLILTEVEYKYIIVPDMILFCVKVYTVMYSLSVVFGTGYKKDYKFDAVEKLVESVLFATFLMIIFIGKLSKGKYMSNYAIVCLKMLMVCFGATLIFEIAKLPMKISMHEYPFIIVFNFIKGVLNEAFLDMPYFLLVLTLCFTKENILINKMEYSKLKN